MTGEIERLKQDLEVMEKAVGNRPVYGMQHVGLGVGFGVAGLVTLLLTLFTSVLSTMPTRAIMIPIFLGIPLLSAWLFSPKPFKLTSIMGSGPTKAESNVVAIIVATAVIGFAFLLKSLHVIPYGVVASVSVMMSAVFLFPIAWGRPQNSWIMVHAVVFCAMAVALLFIPLKYCTVLFAVAFMISGSVSAAVLYYQVRKSAQ